MSAAPPPVRAHRCSGRGGAAPSTELVEVELAHPTCLHVPADAGLAVAFLR